jgi:ribosome-associated protein
MATTKKKPAKFGKTAKSGKPARFGKPTTAGKAKAAFIPKKRTASNRKPAGAKAKRPPRGPRPVIQGKGRNVTAPARRPVRKVALAGPTPETAAKGAAAKAASRPDPARPTALAIAQAGLDKKAEDVMLLDVRGLTSYADYFVVMTADSDRQASAIADSVDETLKKMGVTKVGVEGYQGGRWILVDFGDVVAHVFNRESRGFYDLEGLWADAPRQQIEG